MEANLANLDEIREIYEKLADHYQQLCSIFYLQTEHIKSGTTTTRQTSNSNTIDEFYCSIPKSNTIDDS